MRNVSVTGVGMSKFGKHQHTSLKSLALSACRDALIDAGKPKIDAVFTANLVGPQLAKQEILDSILASELGLGAVPTLKMSGACASGGISFRQAYEMVSSGVHDTVLVVGVEKMTHRPTGEVTQVFNSAFDDDSNEAGTGITFPAFFGATANRYMHEYGATKEHLAMVALKNRNYAVNNPKAQFTKPTTMDEIMTSKTITSPLGLFDCSPMTDGAAAVVLTAKESGVKVIASGQGSGLPLMQEIDDLLTIRAVRESAKQVYETAGVGPEDIDVVEVHDCFSITELITIEELGFFEKGTGWEAVEQGLTTHEGKIPVNTSGGLLSRGHPIGATGISQVIQIVEQLRGRAANQVEGARIGMTQNLGGTGTYSVVHLFEGKGA